MFCFRVTTVDIFGKERSANFNIIANVEKEKAQAIKIALEYVAIFKENGVTPFSVAIHNILCDDAEDKIFYRGIATVENSKVLEHKEI